MKTKVFILVALAALMMTSCNNAIREISRQAKQEFKDQHNYRDSKKWGKVITKDIEPFAEFTSIQLSGNVDIHISQGDTVAIKAYGNEKAIDEYQFTFDSDNDGCTKLAVDLKGFTWDATKENHNVDKNTPAITVYVTIPKIEDITIYGAGDIDIQDSFQQEESLSVNINGAGDFDTDHIDVNELKVNVHGAGDVYLDKVKCMNNATCNINGAGNIEGKIKCKNLELIVNGAGNINTKVKCYELTAACNGVGDIKLKGECQIFNKKDGPVGSIDSRDLKVYKKINIK